MKEIYLEELKSVQLAMLQDVAAMIETSAFEGVLMQEFEGREYKIPIGYDKWLRKIYGDYMQLPPVEKRINHHIFDAWWKE